MINFWKNKKILVTGHTGFKGSWLTMLLIYHGAKVYGISSNTSKSKDQKKLFNLCKLEKDIKSKNIDIRNLKKLQSAFNELKPDIVFHLAAQPLVYKSYDNPVETFEVNAIGTVNVLECIRKTKSAKIGIIVTSDKVYKNTNSIYPYNEDSNLGGHDPYSASKALSEIITSSYCNSFFKKNKFIATVRAGNVIGGGDWSENRIIPDLIKAWRSKKKVKIRNPNHIRPWQHVLDPLNGYLKLAEFIFKKKINYDNYNFGPEIDDTYTVKKLVEEVCKVLGKKSFVNFQKNNKTFKKEEDQIYLEINKSKKILKFKPKFNFEISINKTISWYKNFYNGEDVRSICENEIKEYFEK